jgi:hypothetical protein
LTARLQQILLVRFHFFLHRLKTLGVFLLFAFRLIARLNFSLLFLSTVFKWSIYEQCNC